MTSVRALSDEELLQALRDAEDLTLRLRTELQRRVDSDPLSREISASLRSTLNQSSVLRKVFVQEELPSGPPRRLSVSDPIPINSPVRVLASTGTMHGILLEYSHIPGGCKVKLTDGSVISAPTCNLELDEPA